MVHSVVCVQSMSGFSVYLVAYQTKVEKAELFVFRSRYQGSKTDVDAAACVRIASSECLELRSGPPV